MERLHSATLAIDWQTVWEEHAGWLRTVLRARVRDDGAADELLQAVNVTAWTRRDQLCDQTRVGPWLYRIALRQVLMFWRSHDRERRRCVSLDALREPELADPRNHDPLRWLTRNEIHQQIRTSLETLNAQDREILMLKHSEHWTYRQIANHLGLSNDKVIYRLERARGRLRQQLSSLKADWEQP